VRQANPLGYITQAALSFMGNLIYLVGKDQVLAYQWLTANFSLPAMMRNVKSPDNIREIITKLKLSKE
jgi:hypothetical protein